MLQENANLETENWRFKADLAATLILEPAHLEALDRLQWMVRIHGWVDSWKNIR